MEFKDFKTLKKNLKQDFSNLKTLSIAVMGDTATQLYVQALKGYAYELAFELKVIEADYNQIEIQIFNKSSELYEYKPEFIIIFYSSTKMLDKFAKLDIRGKSNFAKEQVEKIETLYNTIGSTLNSKILLFNFHEINDAVFGNYSNKTNYSFIYQIRKLNFELMNLAQQLQNLYIIDLSILQNQYGNTYITDSKIYINTELFFNIDFLPIIAKNTLDVILAISGKFNKCLILDLDNTLWGGIIGDDGLENIQLGELGIGKAFSEIQSWAKQLRQRGIILAICSKNDEKIAKEPFIKHPDMILRLEDIAVFVANWDNKADNIRYIQRILNIGFDSIVFLDDSPFERNIIRELIPEITVPELPDDPAEYLNYLQKLNLFETASFTEEDENRTKQYQEEASRAIVQKQYANEDDFLINLEMVSLVESFNKFNIPRVSQLTQRSNQYNLRTVRYTEEEINKITFNTQYETLAFSLSDKFGDYGLISVIILHKRDDAFFVDTWIMSCRVLKRGMENFVLNTIIKKISEIGFKKIIGEYISTSKNQMVRDHYKNLGFSKISNDNNIFVLQVDEFKELKTLIKQK